ncbi:MAG: phosphocarrier protein HPr [Elusimicrobia bacterium RIFCSPLOWO2_01_FULL_60_11]|nr:MAG: phosphocarrier protein HPr [Elusimicrobia bacterium RIFCSPLOWO2_01_FULL_60_11]
MIECELTVQNRLGLHARPASLFVQTTNKYKSKVRVMKDAMEVDGKSIMGLLMLAAPMGTVLKITAEGEDESDVIEHLKKLFKSRFGEDSDYQVAP